MNNLIKELVSEEWLKSKEIIKAFERIKREDFVLEKSLAEFNSALSIGYNQTISQPLVVAFMLEKLEVKKEDKVLDIGSGSGYTTALLSCLSDDVTAIELIPELKEYGEKNVAKYGFKTEFVLGDGSKGYSKNAPYNKILCSAEARKVFDAWKGQLVIGGRIVTPIGNSICVFDKISDKEFLKKCYSGFVFVPLIENK